MEKYILGITPDAIEKQRVSIDELINAMKDVPGLTIKAQFMERFSVLYPGTIEELRLALDYSHEDVHIVKPLRYLS